MLLIVLADSLKMCIKHNKLENKRYYDIHLFLPKLLRKIWQAAVAAQSSPLGFSEMESLS